MIIDPDEFPITHEILDDETHLRCQMTWDYWSSDQIACRLPLFNTTIVIVPTRPGCFTANINGQCYNYQKTDIYGVMAEVEDLVDQKILSFLNSYTNLPSLIREDPEGALYYE